jgi:hypothetical protein
MRRATLGLATSLALIPVSVAAETVDRDSTVKALRAQIARCWSAPARTAHADGLIVVVRVKLNRDGSLAADPTLVNSGTGLFDVVAESAVNAIRRCQPFKLPVAAYDFWKEVDMAFVPAIPSQARQQRPE